MARVIDAVGDYDLHERRHESGDHYGTLVRAIVGQQVSTAAARAINARLRGQFGDRWPTPEEVLAADPDELRVAAGLSRGKMSYLRSLAEHVTDGSLELDRLEELPDEEVVAELTAVKGIGAWTAHMFMIFQLGRPDVLAWGDLGVRRAAMLAYGLDELPSRSWMEERGEAWRPWRSVACLLLWRSLAATPA
jgi:DNA-3-methyladenine glycosylase II